MTREWYFQAMGQDIGPLSVAELKSKVANGQVQADTLIRKGPEGKWVFGANVKGLFAEPAAAAISPASKPKPASPNARPGTSPDQVAVASPKITDSDPPANQAGVSHSSALTSIAMVDDEVESGSQSMEFYDFVGFREAITPVLHDAIKKFSVERGIKLGQLNRLALASFIQRPELASELIVQSLESVPQRVNEKSIRDGRHPVSDEEISERATFRVTLFNASHHPVSIHEAVFLPQKIEQRTYDTIGPSEPPTIDHKDHHPVRLNSISEGNAVRIKLEVTVPSQETRDVVLWFTYNAKPSLLVVRGQLLFGHGSELAMSDFFTVVIHGESPSPPG